MTEWEVRTNGRRFVVCDVGSAPSRANPHYLPRYSYATFEAADAAMQAAARRYKGTCTPGRAARVEVADPAPRRSRQVPGWLSPC